MQRGFSIAPLAFFEVKREVNFNAVELSEAAFGKTPEGLDAIDVSLALGESFGFVDTDVAVIADVDESVVTRPSVGADDALRIDFTLDNASDRGLRAIGDDFGVDLAATLENSEDGLFAGASSPQPGQRTASHSTGSEIAFIDFHHSSQPSRWHLPMHGDHQSEALVIGVDRLSIDLH